jgi:proteasome lid subunit RPN8/RPN11
MSMRVVIQDHTHSKKTTVELPDEVTMQRLLPALAQRMQLPLQQAGNPVIYRLDNRRTGRRLDDEDTLRSAGVQPDDVLTLLPEVTAGAGTIDEIEIASTESATPRTRKPSWAARGTLSQPVMIRFHDDAFRVIDAEASGTDDEVGGLLIGDVVVWDGTPYVDVEAALPGERTRAGPAHITFTADTWAELLRRKEKEFPDRWIVGWYHSHPRMGIFLSEMDVTLHRHFFPQPWHVALVVDAQDEELGFFCRVGDDIRRVEHLAWQRRTRGKVAPWIWISVAAGILTAVLWPALKGKKS